jgi:hypothetical protein
MKIHKYIVYTLLVGMSWLPSLSFGKGSIDPSNQTCTIVFLDGSTTQGNGKNDLCLLYANDPEVVVIPHYTFNPDTFFFVYNCVTDTDEPLEISKKVFRANSYIVKAFGQSFTGFDTSLDVGIPNQLMVTTKSSAQYEPWSLVFQSDEQGEPYAVTMHLQPGRAPLYYDLQCEPY